MITVPLVSGSLPTTTKRFFNPGFREKMESLPNADEKLTYTISEAKRLNLSIYLFIDEYDNFTNAILANMGEKHYKALTHVRASSVISSTN